MATYVVLIQHLDDGGSDSHRNRHPDGIDALIAYWIDCMNMRPDDWPTSESESLLVDPNTRTGEPATIAGRSWSRTISDR
jgi:hypothetical protein